MDPDERRRHLALAVHHIDHIHGNNDPVNLVPAHGGCHATHHVKGVPRSSEFKKKVSDGLKRAYAEGRRTPTRAFTGRSHTDESKERIADGVTRAWADGRLRGGWKLSDETRKRQSEARRARGR